MVLRERLIGLARRVVGRLMAFLTRGTERATILEPQGASANESYHVAESTNPDASGNIAPLGRPPLPSHSPISKPNPISAAAGSTQPTQNTGSTGWECLKVFLSVLNRGAGAFGPLKIVVDELVGFIEVYEEAANGREEYARLRDELGEIFKSLTDYFRQSVPPTITGSMERLCKSIQNELDFVQGKQNRGSIRRHLEARVDSGEVLACYQRIHGHLQRFSLNANTSTWRIVDEMATDRRLDRLSPSLSALYNSAQAIDLRRGGCTPNTRVDVLAQMHGWVYNPSTGSVYWLNGMAGTGKTTISYTLCAELKESKNLAASFFCSRSLPECRDVNKIIPSIAYQLAQFSYPFRCALSQVLEKERDAHALSVQPQFETLIVQPLLKVGHTLPEDLVVVIDALDECENKKSTSKILDALLTKTSKLKLPIKFFVSSRPEPEIRDQMKKQADKTSRLVLHELDKGEVQGDIKTYLREALSPMNPSEEQIKALADRAGILFIYAATVVRYISYDNFERQPHVRLGAILSATSSAGSGVYKDVDELYTVILKSAIEDPNLDEAEKEDIKKILNIIICVREPLTISALSGLLGMHNTGRVRAALRPLWSVLHVVESNELVTTLHASFPDYMLDLKRSNDFHCDSAKYEYILALRCFDCIKEAKTRFNICDLETSSLPDDKVTDLNVRIEQAIPSERHYACRYWASHLERTSGTDELIERLNDFMSNGLLLWMEVLNLKGCISIGARSMYEAERWSTEKCSEGIQSLAHDAWRFVTTFASSPVSKSTPHIYVSMLAFWPESSPIGKHYVKRCLGTRVLEEAALSRRENNLLATWKFDAIVTTADWSPDGTRVVMSSGGRVLVLDALTSQVVNSSLYEPKHLAETARFSPDGTRVACGFKDGTIRVWDLQAGKKAYTISSGLGLLKGHTKSIRSIAFSPNGACIVSGSEDETLYVWNAQDGKKILGPLKKHTATVTSVSFSPDGTRIVSSSYDGTILLWDARSGHTLLSPFRGHTKVVSSVGFSPDGARIVSGSFDRTMCLWDTRNGKTIFDLPNKFKHTDNVNSVAFSSNGALIVSGSSDQTIRLWDAQSGGMVLGPLRGHTGAVLSVTFSPDGSRILSSSDDRTIRLWDTRNSGTKLQPAKGHTGLINSVAFSPDGTHIVSGSADGTVRLWGPENKEIIFGRRTESPVEVLSVGFSPDGARIISGSADMTIKTWEVPEQSTSSEVKFKLYKGHTHWVSSVVFSPDGTRIASGSCDETVCLWDSQNGKMILGPLTGHTSLIRSVRFTPDGTRIVSASNDHTICLWDAQDGRLVVEPLKGHTKSINSVAVSPDGALIASGSNDHTIRLWDVQSGEMKHIFEGHTDYVRSVGFSPNGTRIASCSRDGTIRLWNTSTKQCCLTLQYTNSFTSVRFSPDGTQVVSSAKDTIHVWDVRDAPSIPRVSSLPVLIGGTILSDPNKSVLLVHQVGPAEWKCDEDGWVMDAESKLLLWVPPDLSRAFGLPREIIRLGTCGFIQPKFENAQIGNSWTACYSPA